MFIFSSFCDFLALVLNIHAGEDFFLLYCQTSARQYWSHYATLEVGEVVPNTYNLLFGGLISSHL